MSLAMSYTVVSAFTSLLLMGLQSDRLRAPGPAMAPGLAERVLFVAAVLLWIIGVALLLFSLFGA